MYKQCVPAKCVARFVPKQHVCANLYPRSDGIAAKHIVHRLLTAEKDSERLKVLSLKGLYSIHSGRIQYGRTLAHRGCERQRMSIPEKGILHQDDDRQIGDLKHHSSSRVDGTEGQAHNRGKH